VCSRWKGKGDRGSAHGEDRKGEGITEGWRFPSLTRTHDGMAEGRNQSRTKKLFLF
jgi:hypothetical protein